MTKRDIQRNELIDLLVFITGRAETYFQGMTDDQLFEEYERLNNRQVTG